MDWIKRILPVGPVDEEKVNWDPAEYEGKPNPNHLKKKRLYRLIINTPTHGLSSVSKDIQAFQLMSAHLRLLEDWHQDEEAADDEEDDGQDDVHLDRSLQVGLFPPVTTCFERECSCDIT